MSAATTDPALVASPATDLSPVITAAQAAQVAQAAQIVQVSEVGQDPQVAPIATSAPKERHSLTLDQRRALRRWAADQPVRPSHKACIDWFYHEYGQTISQSTVSHSLSPKYARLDGDNPQLSGSRLRFGNWPDVEKLVLVWYQQVQASGRQPTNEELGEKAKSIFSQLPRYKDENPPEFSPGWIHRFKKRYGLLVRRMRRLGEERTLSIAEDINYLADYVPRLIPISENTNPAEIREEVSRAMGVEPRIHTCIMVRDEIVRRMSEPQPPQQQPQELVTGESALPPPQPDQPMYGDDDPELALQNALRHLQQEAQAAEQQAADQQLAAQREERDRAERSAMPPSGMMTTPGGRASSVSRYTSTPAQDLGPELTLTPINSEGPISDHDRPLRCPFCVNQRMLRTIKEAVEHMSTHVVV